MKFNYNLPVDIDPIIIAGVHDSNLRLIERLLNVKIYTDNQYLNIEGEDENLEKARKLLNNLCILARHGNHITHHDIKLLFENTKKLETSNYDEILHKGLVISKKNKVFKVKNYSQLNFLKMILEKDITIAYGCAGTGKTYIAVGAALYLLHNQSIDKIIITRPVVEAGENLGFLPGTLEEKIDPYLKPIYDSIEKLIGFEEMKHLFNNGIIEISPLAYMRGRTLSGAFVILDEAQNTTYMQMKMFLTRLGDNSKMVINGDTTQIDLDSKTKSGLISAINILKDIEGIGFFEFKEDDIVRNKLVKSIIERYNNYERKQ